VTLPAFIEPALREALGAPALEAKRLVPTSGGCINHAARVETTAGDVFVKWNDSCPEDLFEREAAGLREMSGASSGLAVPRVFGAWGPRADRPALIVMEYLAPGRTAGDEEALGGGLARLHQKTAPEFGFAVPTYCGTTPQENDWTRGWTDFYRDRRLRPLVRLVQAERGLSGGDLRVYERVLDRLPDLLAHETQPSLIHGDLWSGNVLHTMRGPGLVDPAAAYADREMELGITTLFGGFGDRFWRAYEEVWPLPPGWRERNPLYQLYHLLNHQYLFGGHHGGEALALARRYA
jgi:fructosamine-3-kinase